MRVKKLEAIPTAGEYEEVVFEFEGPWRGNGWHYVLFTTSEYEEWLGMFRDQDVANFKVAELDNGTACVISGGHGYIIDIDKRKKLKDLKTERIIDISSDNQTSSFLIATWYNINVVGQTFDEVEIELPIQADGIYFKAKNERKLNLEIEEIGADMIKNTDFYIDLDTMTIKKHMP